jgi:hypothetical protein
VFRRASRLSEDAGVARVSTRRWPRVFEEKVGKPEPKAIFAPYARLLRSIRRDAVALDALDALFTRRAMWAELAENLEVQLGLADTDEGQLGSCCGSRACASARWGKSSPRSKATGRCSTATPRTPSALRALERLGRDAAHGLSIAEILEPLYRSHGEHQKLIGVHEVQVAQADNAGAQGRAAHADRDLHEDSAAIRTRPSTRWRAPGGRPSHADTRQSIDRLARVTWTPVLDLAKVYEDARGRAEAFRSSEATLRRRRPHLRAGRCRTSSAPSSSTQRVLSIESGNSRGSRGTPGAVSRASNDIRRHVARIAAQGVDARGRRHQRTRSTKPR